MSASQAPPLTAAELQTLLRQVEAAALLVPARLLRRVIKRNRRLTSLGLRVPHARSFVIARDALRKLVSAEELRLDPALPPRVILLACPDEEQLASTPRESVLLETWRLLFHTQVHRALAERPLDRRAVRQRVHALGQAEFDEIRTVLRAEKLLLPPRDDRAVYEEFVAVYLELRHFAHALLLRYFPALGDLQRVDALLMQDVDGASLFAATRLPGAPDPIPVETADTAPWDEENAVPWNPAILPQARSLPTLRRLDEQANRAAAVGNVVRAAVCHAQAAWADGPEGFDRSLAQAAAQLERLCERLQAALDLAPDEMPRWRAALQELLSGAAHGVWPAEARLLYDLQKCCVDHERPLYKPDLVEWAYTRFRQPLVRPLPLQPLVLAVRHLRSAAGRLPAVRVAAAVRQTLSELLHAALHHAESRLRERCRPVFTEVLDEVALHAENFPEAVARRKLVEELTDRVVEHGFLTLGHLRDALSRNELKLSDVAGPLALLTGDALLRANRLLAERLPGVYRRGEVYLRGMQRVSALAFGTRAGRWLTLFLLLPFGAAYGTVVFVQELLHLIRLPHHLDAGPLGLSVGLLGFFFLALLHMPRFRTRVVAAACAVGRFALRAAVELPAAVVRLPWVRRLLAVWPFWLTVSYVLKPLPTAAAAGALLWATGFDPVVWILAAFLVQVVASLLLNSRMFRDLEEWLVDWLVRQWEYLHDFLPGLYHWVLDLFRALLQHLERYLYSVDEWLRFRRGQGNAALIAKTALGLVWFVASYGFRVLVVVFLEPWINPIKHFPAVTVAAKLLLPMMVPMIAWFAEPLLFLSAPVAYAVAFFLVKAIPGGAGFLAWELQENWRLYRANRPATLGPVVVGHHGETLPRLLRPGFHSGTLPKLYGKLRRAERRAHRGGSWRPVRKLRKQLHEVDEVLQHFAERELLAFLTPSRAAALHWTAGPVHVAAVEAGSNRIRFLLSCPAVGASPLEVRLEEQSGWLLAEVASPGWLTQLSASDRQTLATALAGFYHRAGVGLVREQVRNALPASCVSWDVQEDGLTLWTGEEFDTVAVYNLESRPCLFPTGADGKRITTSPTLAVETLLWAEQPLSWNSWVEAWEKGKLPKARVLPE